MKFFFILLLCSSQTFAFSHEKVMKTKAESFAKAEYTSARNHSWPFPLLSIGHNMQSYQDYSGSPYWHDGLDIRSQVDQPILAAAGGKVVNIENYVSGNYLYWEVAILDDEGFVWKYHHVKKESIPEALHAAYKTGGRVEDGALIGTVVKWPVTTMGEVYHHLHLLVVAKDGKYINPFLMMTQLPDTAAPIIHKIGIAKNHKPLAGTQVSGEHAIFLDASDLTLHEKFLLPPHKISYRLDKGEEKLVWEFINLPSGKNDTDYINDFYMVGTCGNYSCRKFYFNLNFTPAMPRKTLKLQPGGHEIEVTVEDVVGNKSTETFNWKVI